MSNSKARKLKFEINLFLHKSHSHQLSDGKTVIDSNWPKLQEEKDTHYQT
jgi:hypothetical protein